MKDIIFNLLTGVVGDFIGRRNLVRIGAFLMRAGRQDMPNSIAKNGEVYVQKTILNNAGGDEVFIIDCGANIGQWSTQLVATARSLDWKAGLNLFCFEPSSYTHAKLNNALGELQLATLNVSAIQKALSSASGSMNLKIAHDGAGTNSLVGVPGSYESEEIVDVTTLSKFAAESSINHIHLLKIDAEGHDFDVILGADKLLCAHRIDVIQFEYNWRWIYGKHFLLDIFEYLGQREYSVGKITPQGIQFYPHYDIQMESFVEGNYLACTEQYKRHFKQVPSWLD